MPSVRTHGFCSGKKNSRSISCETFRVGQPFCYVLMIVKKSQTMIVIFTVKLISSITSVGLYLGMNILVC